MKTILKRVLFVLLFVPLISFAQTTVSGTVTEQTSSLPLPGVNVVINLVYLHEDTSGYNIDQTDTTSMSPSLNALRLTTDGNLDYIHQMRIDYGADMVALITAGAGCGIAYLNSGYSTMFSVTRYDCATGYYSFGHELGMLYKLAAAVFFVLSFF